MAIERAVKRLQKPPKRRCQEFNSPPSPPLRPLEKPFLKRFYFWEKVRKKAHSLLSPVQAKCRTREPLHHGRDFLNTTRGASEGVETLEADQGEEDIDRLIEGFRSRSSVLLSKPLNNDTKTLPSPFVSCPYHMLKIWIEGRQSSEPTHHEPIGAPEATEDGNVFIQRIERFGATEGVGQVLHPPMGGKGVAQSFEEPDFGAELVVDGHAGNVGLAGDGVNAKAREA